VTSQQTLTRAQVLALFGHWRLILMGNRASRTRIPTEVRGYFFSAVDKLAPVPLAELRRELLQAISRADLTVEERMTVHLYFGFHGLPLPFGSKQAPDIAAGRDESTPRRICRRALAKIASHLEPRPLATSGRRPTVNPTLEGWFQSQATTRQAKVTAIARSFVKAMAMCDGPHGTPTMIALEKWYRDCGYCDPHIQIGHRVKGRPNKHALARAAALMEICLYEEVHVAPLGTIPVPASMGDDTPHCHASIELVTHPELVSLTTNEMSPESLVQAAVALQQRACNGQDVAGQLALLLRVVRPRINYFTVTQIQYLCVSISYVAATTANPFLALEMLGIARRKAGVTDRTFTVLVNTIEAATSGGHHQLAERIDKQFVKLQTQWVIPETQISRVEHIEATQQHLVANSFRLQGLGIKMNRSDRYRIAVDALEQSTKLATQATMIAHKVLTDSSAFPPRDLEGKSGRHGGDLTSAWLLAATARTMESATELTNVAIRQDQWTPQRRNYVSSVAGLAQSVLPECENVGDSPGFVYWRELVSEQASRLIDA